MNRASPAAAVPAFQHDFMRALLDPASDALPALTRQPAFAVYRNTVIKGCIDALEANHPAVARLVGRDWFRAAAAVHVASTPPDDPRLVLYGGRFADFLRDFPPAASLPYLPDVARLDRLWVLAHVAADAPVLPANALSGLAPQALGARLLRPHPAAHWHWSADHPAHTIWSCNRMGEPVPDDLAWQGQGTLLTRPHDTVQWCALGKGGSALLDACAQGRTLAEAAGAAFDCEPSVDLAALLSDLLGQGAFTTSPP